jgi:hypothetical protein
MKKITKSVEPPEFTEWKLDDKMDHRPRWNRVVFETRRVIHESLMREQGLICCYCESRITMEDSHVEHFCPRGNSKDVEIVTFDELLSKLQNLRDFLSSDEGPTGAGGEAGEESCDVPF